MASGSIASWQIQREKVEALTDFIFLCFNPKECSNYHTTAFISHASKVMLKTQVRLKYMTGNFQMYKLDLEKAEEPEVKLPASAGS